MEPKVLDTIFRFNLLAPGDHVLVAVSGGADSLCLLYLLKRQSKKLGIKLHAVYINHGLRPEADSEAAFVKKHAIMLNIPVSVRRVDVNFLKKECGYSKQDAARRLRYACLCAVAKKIGANRIAIAHHLDDRVETLLLRLLGGSGLDGLAGIPVKREIMPGIDLIRPLYNTWRTEIESYCKKNGLSPVLDRSNLSVDYLRNRIRLHLLPYLREEFGEHVSKVLAKTTELLEIDSSLLIELTEKAYKNIVSRKGKVLHIIVRELLKLPLALQLRLLRRAMWEVGVERPSSLHAESVLGLAQGRLPSSETCLPGGVRAKRDYNTLLIGKGLENKKLDSRFCVLQVPGCTVLPWSGRSVNSSIISVKDITLPLEDKNEAYLDLDLLQMPLIVRTRKPGDRIWLLGAPGKRKIKEILIDKKVSLPQRNILPVIQSGEHIAWLGGIDISHIFRITKASKRVLHLKYL